MIIKRVRLDTLHVDPGNVRLHGDENMAAIRGSLTRFGQAEPLVVQKSTSRVIGGNGRLAAMQQLRWTECEIVEVDVDDRTARALSVALNRTAELATWDTEALAKLLEQLRAEDALQGVGYDASDIDELLADLEASTATPRDVDDPGPAEPPQQPVSRREDLWLLGDHRLLCGDSTSADDVARLMAGDTAALLSTDPPYCVDYTGMDRPVHDGKPSGKDWSHLYREVDIADLGVFLDGVLNACLPHVVEDAAIYMWHAHVQQPTIAATFERHGLLLHQVLVWVKPVATFGHSYYRWKHEPCAFGWKRGNKPKHGFGLVDSVWEIDWEGKQRVVGNEHPCLHPDALVLTDAGWRAIKSIEVGAKVLAADGRFHAVTDASSHRYTSQELFRIVARGSNVPTLASDNHPFLIWRPRKVRRCIVDGEVAWLRADELRIGDYTMTPVMVPDEVDPFPDRDEEYWFLFGLYLAQGHLQRAGHGTNCYPSFTIHKKRQDLVARIHGRWSKTSNYDHNDYGNEPTQGLTVMAFDPEAGAEFEHFGSRHAHAKRIDPVVLKLPRQKRLAVLQGWLNGDGCKVHNRSYWQGKTVSGDLAAHLALLGESVGYRTSVFRYEPPPVLGKIMGRQILSQRAEYHLYFYERQGDGWRGKSPYVRHEGHEYQLRRVKSVDRIPYVGDVWNLSVDGCPSFQTSVGMSHNTQKPTRLFEIPMEQHTRPGAVVLEPFSGSGSQIIAAEKLARRCRAMEIQPAFVDVAIRRWEKATGRAARLEATGQTFVEVAAERGVASAPAESPAKESTQ